MMAAMTVLARFRTFVFVLLLFWMGSFAQEASAVTIRVPTNQPTIQSAIDISANGDTVLVAPGRYAERLDFKGKSIVLTSEQGAPSTTIDGASQGTVLTFQSGETVATTVRGFTITGGNESFGAGAYLLNSSATFEANIFAFNTQQTGGAGAAILGFNGSPVIVGNQFFSNTCDDQFLSGVLSFVNDSAPTIFNNIIRDNACRAINMTLPESATPTVANNTLVRNRVGIYVDRRVSTASHTYKNNLIAFNEVGLDAVFGDGTLDATWANNLIFGNGVNVRGTTILVGIAGNIASDPMFVSAAANDFRLWTGSPALDAGSTLGLTLPATDFFGNARVRDDNGDGVASIDIGAVEGATSIAQAAAFAVPTTSPIALALLTALLSATCGFIVSVRRRTRA